MRKGPRPSPPVPVPAVGDIFGRLIVRKVGLFIVVGKDRRRAVAVDCSCGTVGKLVRVYSLHNGTESCGCLTAESASARFTTHGCGSAHDKDPTYVSWGSMIKRCEDPKTLYFELWGGRGIKVCTRWRDSFAAFLADMGPRPSLNHSLDRHPNMDGDYEPGNCRWATRTEQARNRRSTVWITIDGETKCLAEWSTISGVDRRLIVARIRELGWPEKEAVFTLTKKHKKVA